MKIRAFLSEEEFTLFKYYLIKYGIPFKEFVSSDRSKIWFNGRRFTVYILVFGE